MGIEAIAQLIAGLLGAGLLDQKCTRQVSKKAKGQPVGWPKCLNYFGIMVGRDRFELSTYGLRVRCSTN
jgi:hypothetical protein